MIEFIIGVVLILIGASIMIIVDLIKLIYRGKNIEKDNNKYWDENMQIVEDRKEGRD